MENRNIEMTALKAFGIIAVVSCHTGVNLFKLFGIRLSDTVQLFPEYSFHMPLFIFISGYFYKRIYEEEFKNLIKKRFSSIKKYMKCNLFYLVLSFIFVSTGFLNRNIEYSLKSFFIEPLLGGFQFYFNGPGWFVPFLFFTQVTYTALRKGIGAFIKTFNSHNKVNFKQELLFLVILITLGIAATIIAKIHPVINEEVKFTHSFTRVLFGLQFFQLGFIHRTLIESNIKFSVLSFIIIILSKILFISLFENYTFSLRTLMFNEGIIIPIIVSILGILYCLHISKYISYLVSKSNSKLTSLILAIGDNTWSIMMHHLLIKWLFNKLYTYTSLPNNTIAILNYFVTPILCILLPIFFSNMYNKIKSYISNNVEPKTYYININ